MAKRNEKKLTILEIAHHRNGVTGEGFHVIRFIEPAEGKDVMVGIVFNEPGYVAVLSVNMLAGLDQEATVAFGANSWRGDFYAPALRRAIKEAE